MVASTYDDREIVACRVIPNSDLKFGWRSPSGVKETTRTMLGHVPGINADGSYVTGFILGANFPQPPRMQKRGVGNYYCAIDRVNETRADGWRQASPAKYLRGGKRAKTTLVVIDLRLNNEEGNPVGPVMKIARYMRDTTKGRITAADLAALGVEETTAADSDLIYGAEYPVPPEARFTAVSTESKVDTYGTMIDPKKIDTMPAGWALTANGKY
ncbi:hypothetical protein [Coleofasciculus sp. E2-BRE-01]|uniref:hypothetical protein n=1 Tax=Coleofasciculus sp. E2-BRE-01 TaxID=3069524 RepID=UPI0032F5202F